MNKIATEAKAFGSFLTACRAELRKITWPRRPELIESTWVVAALLGLLSTFVFLSDVVLETVIKFVTGAK